MIVLKLFLALAFILLLIPKNSLERFEIAGPIANTRIPSSRDIFKMSTSYTNFDAEMKARRSTMTDRDDLLIMHRCYQFTPGYFDNFTKQPDLQSVSFSLTTDNFADIRTRIIKELIDLKDKTVNQKLIGPAYAFVTQAPYFIDMAGKPMTVQYHINQYIYKPYNILVADSATKPVIIKVTLVIAPPQQFLNNLVRFQSMSKKCLIECKGENDSICGCLNQTDYKSTCLKSNPARAIKADYVNLYKINPDYKSLSLANVF